MTNKIYMENSYLREIEANVVEKKYLNNKYYVKLDRTIFYPHLSGGQPGDKGTINGIEVIETIEKEEDIIHVLKDNFNGNRVNLCIDWDNRLDLMQQHTGQHLLSAVFYKLFNADTSSFNIGERYIHIDIDKSTLSDDEAKQVEFLSNRIIYSNFKIKSYFIAKDKIENIPLRKQPTVDSNIRIVEIDSFDYSPCGGTHLNNTGEIGIIKIRKWERKKGKIRVEFVCGNRALTDYSWKNQYINEIGTRLSAKDVDVLNKVENLIASKESLEKDNRLLRESLYKLKGDALINDVQVKNGINFICKEIDDMDYKELGLIASQLNDSKEKLIQVYGIQNADIAQFYISLTKDIDINLKDIYQIISTKFDIKGGGNTNLIQGKCKTEDINSIMVMFIEQIVKENKTRNQS